MREMSKTKEYVIMGMVMKDRLIKGMVRIVMEYMCKMGWMAMLMMKNKYEMLEVKVDRMIKEWADMDVQANKGMIS